MPNSLIFEPLAQFLEPGWPIVELTGAETAPRKTNREDVPIEPEGTTYPDIVELLDDKVRFAVESLPEDFRSVVIKADLEDKSYKQISSELDCPMGTVMSRLFRGRKLLREKLREFAQERGLIPHTP